MFLWQMKPGKPLEIVVTRDGYSFRFVSKIEVVNQQEVYVTLIANVNRAFQIRSTDKIEIIYRDERIWKWNNVAGRIAELEGDRLHCFCPEKSQGKSFNRRNAYRVYIGKEVLFHRYTLNKEKIEEYRKSNPDISLLDIMKEKELFDETMFKGILKDLSENGAGIYSNEKLEEEDKLFFQFDTSFGRIECNCSVIRLEKAEGTYHYFYGCKLDTSSNCITKYLFDQQRKQLYKTRNRR